jgi:hypothetical protein
MLLVHKNRARPERRAAPLFCSRRRTGAARLQLGLGRVASPICGGSEAVRGLAPAAPSLWRGTRWRGWQEPRETVLDEAGRKTSGGGGVMPASRFHEVSRNGLDRHGGRESAGRDAITAVEPPGLGGSRSRNHASWRCLNCRGDLPSGIHILAKIAAASFRATKPPKRGGSRRREWRSIRHSRWTGAQPLSAPSFMAAL